MSHILAPYKAIIYDSMCIIYYCFQSKREDYKGNLIIIDAPRGWTDLIRAVTRFIKNRQGFIYTTQNVIDEIKGKDLAEIVKKRIYREDIRNALLLDSKPLEDIELDIVKTVKKNIDKKLRRLFKRESWFVVEEFRPLLRCVEDVENLYKRLYQEPEYKKRFKPYDPIPSKTDIRLMLFSVHKSFPLISNDGHFTKFVDELEGQNYAYKIIPLESLRNNYSS